MTSVKCKTKQSPILTFGKIYKVIREYPLQFKIKTDNGKIRYYRKNSSYFEIINEHVDLPELDQVQNIASNFLKKHEIVEHTLNQKDGNTVLLIGLMTDFYKRLKRDLK